MTNASAKWMPELGHCSCGERAWMVLGQNGWFVRCNCCGKDAEASYDEDEAVANWRVQHEEQLQVVAA